MNISNPKEKALAALNAAKELVQSDPKRAALTIKLAKLLLDIDKKQYGAPQMENRRMNKSLLREFIDILEVDGIAQNEADTSQAGEEAARLGLQHVGYGNYADQKGMVTHKSVNGKLQPVTPKDKYKASKGLERDAKTTGTAWSPERSAKYNQAYRNKPATSVSNANTYGPPGIDTEYRPNVKTSDVGLQNIAKKNAGIEDKFKKGRMDLPFSPMSADIEMSNDPFEKDVESWIDRASADGTFKATLKDKAVAALQLAREYRNEKNGRKSLAYMKLAKGLLKKAKEDEQPIEDNPEVDQNYPFQPEPQQ